MTESTSTPNQSDSAFEILEVTQATELVQGMESRGDFKFRGIYTVFNTILEWTNRFSSNGILPTAEQVSRESSMDLDRTRIFINELLGRGSNKTRLILFFPSMEFHAGTQDLTRMVVFCRPTKADGITARRYYLAYVEKNLKAVQNWLDARSTRNDSEYTRAIHEKIRQGKLPDTHYGAEISRFFYHDYDTTPEQKKQTYQQFVRPILQKLIQNKKLLYIALKGSTHPYKGIFLNRMDELEAGFTILTEYHNANISGSVNLSVEEPEMTARELHNISDAQLSSMSPGNRQVILELRLLAPAVLKLRKEQHESKVKESLEKILEDLVKRQSIVDLTRLKIVDDDIRRAVMRASGVLHTDFPSGGQVVDYILHKKSVDQALKNAIERFEKNRDDLEVQILSAMGIEQYLDSDQMRMFQELEKKVLFQRLPWLVRIWRFFFGKGQIRPEESAAIKRELQKAKESEKLRIQTQEARKAQKRLASERMKGEGEEEDAATKLAGTTQAVFEQSPEDPVEENQASLSINSEETLRAEEDLRNIVEILDRAWKEGKFPNREYLLQQLDSERFDEDSLVLFLKKFGRKDILSFRIKHDKPEYVWPILISRRFLAQNGNKMLRKAMADADAQRNASMPNQEKFDVATSLEDFLNRALNK